MSGTCKEWFADIGCKSTLDKEQYTHLVWCAAFASKVENFTDNQQRKGEIECNLKCLSDHCTLNQGYCHNLKVVATSPVA